MDSSEAIHSNNDQRTKGAESGKPHSDDSLSYLGLVAASGYDAFAGPPTDEDAFREQFAIYAGGFVKTASLFLRGRAAVPLAMAAFALDQAKPADTWDNQAWDASLGMGKGAAMRLAFKVASPIPDHALKGAVLGVMSRASEVGFDKDLFLDKVSGERTYSAAADKFTTSVFNKKAIGFDMLVFSSSAGLSYGADKLLSGRISQSPLLSTMSAGATFGFTGGALEEMQRQTRLSGGVGELDLGLIAKKALIKGSLDSVASIPGGLQARHEFLSAQSKLEVKSPVLELQPTTDGRSTDQALRSSAIVESPTIGTDALLIPIRTQPALGEDFLKLSRELGPAERCTIKLPVLKANAPEHFTSEDHFLREGIESVDTPVHVYRYGPTEIIVPDNYAGPMKKVAEFRVAADGADAAGRREIATRILGPDIELANRALPEDFIPSLQASPAQGIARRIILMNTHNTEDFIHQQRLGDDTWHSAASSSPNRDISFYRRNVDIYLHSDFGHEWAHIFKDQQPLSSALFDNAFALKSNSHIQRPHAAIDPNERFAVNLGEEFLHPDPDVFINLCSAAPVDAVIFAQALRPVVAASESPFKAHHQARIDHVDRHVLPEAQQKLLEIAGGSDHTQIDPALRLLLHLGTREQLATLSNTDVSLHGQPISDQLLTKLTAMPNIRNLDVSNTPISANGLGALRGTQLQWLSAANTAVGDNSVAALSGMPSLRHVDLSHTAVSDGGLVHLRSLPNLRSLNVEGTQTSRFGIGYLEKANPELKIGPVEKATAFEKPSEPENPVPVEPLNASSRSDEQLGQDLSNFAHKPFSLDGRRYASVEGFYQSLRYSDPAQRNAIAKLHGKDAKAAGKQADLKDVIVYGGKEIKLGSTEHHQLIERAIRAKLDAHPDIRQALADSHPRPIIHDTFVPEKPGSHLPNAVFADILTRVRESLQRPTSAVKSEGDARTKGTGTMESSPKSKSLAAMLRQIDNPQTLADHRVAEYATAFEDFPLKPVRLVHAGGDCLSFETDTGAILKITYRALDPEFGSRPFDLPILERGTRETPSGKVSYFVQPGLTEICTAADMPALNKLLLDNNYHLWDPSPGQAGFFGPNRELKLLDPFAVGRNTVRMPNLYE